ncbi:MAG: YceI family protein [Bacteroidota bacterium]|nr:YceI family protein [Bacteroidota bacterium]MDP4247015.1 YceI family protein [Bacteroidota bacterium]MDP4254573.1 YceI family protein [Bacteroidota bacterium]MDP4257374.1 YceI family protein [Bacteroidota bacterium]
MRPTINEWIRSRRIGYLYPILALLILAGSAFTFVAIQEWQVAEGYSIAFSSPDVSGVFKTVSGKIAFDEQNPAASQFDMTIDVNSINTGNGLQNKHAKSDEWFDAARYPTIHYTSEKIAKTASGFSVTGTLEMHGVKKPVSIPFTFQRTPKGGVFAGSCAINRSDFSIGKPGGDVAEQIKVDVSVPVTKK